MQRLRPPRLRPPRLRPPLPKHVYGRTLPPPITRARQAQPVIFNFASPGEPHRSTILACMPLQSLLHKGLRGMGQLTPVPAGRVEGRKQGQFAMQRALAQDALE